MPKNSPSQSPAFRELLGCWQAWSDALARHFGSRKSTGADEELYQELHGRLQAAIAAARVEASESNEADESNLELLKSLEALSAPWVDLNCCDQPRRELKQDLLNKSRLYEAQLGGRPANPPRIKRLLLTLAALAALASAGAFIAVAPTSLQETFNDFRRILYGLGVRLEHITFAERILAGTLAMLFLGWWKLRSLKVS